MDDENDTAKLADLLVMRPNSDRVDWQATRKVVEEMWLEMYRTGKMRISEYAASMGGIDRYMNDLKRTYRSAKRRAKKEAQ